MWSHPAYRGSQWHDYVQVNWGKKTGLFPARCALVFSWPVWAIGGEYQPDTPCALVQDVQPKWEEDFERGKIKNPFTKSILFDHYYLNSSNNVDCIDAKFTLIEVESIMPSSSGAARSALLQRETIIQLAMVCRLMTCRRTDDQHCFSQHTRHATDTSHKKQ